VRIDLHTHSTASDGTDTPAELVRKAADAGLDVVALTDHDTTRGHAEAIAALPPGLTLVTGAELSCRVDGVSMHMLAYLFDPEEPALLAERELVRDDRVPRARAMVAKLNELGVPVTWEQVRRIAGDGTVGRPHVASAMVELGVVPTVSDAFTPEWLADGGRAWAPKHETPAGSRSSRTPRPPNADGPFPRPRSPSSPRRDSTASRWTTSITTSRPAPGCAPWPTTWGCSSPAPPTTTAAARPSRSAPTRPTPRSTERSPAGPPEPSPSPAPADADPHARPPTPARVTTSRHRRPRARAEQPVPPAGSPLPPVR
jgi:hypothetical protein